MENDNSMESQSLLTQNETNTNVRQNYSAHDVADAFAEQYYKIMRETPKHAHNFYKDQSVRSHPCADGSMKTVTTLKDIDDEIMVSFVKKWNPNMSKIHAQDSVMESVIVGVTGSLITNDDVARNFAQTFFLFPQEGGGFYVHDDFLQLIEIEKIPLDDVANPVTGQQNNHPEKDSTLETAQVANKDQTKKSTEKSTFSKEDVDTKIKVSESSQEKNPLSTEPKKKSQPSVWLSSPNIQDSKKVSYASILAKESSVPSSSTQASPKAVAKVSPKTEKRVSTTAEHKSSTINPHNGPLENTYDVKAIRVKDLPPKITQESLLEVVKQFGPVKQKNIQIKEYSQDGYRYAFVEFDNPKSARAAIEARFIQFEDRESEIQYKFISNQGPNFMGRPQRGGFRNDNFWSREGEGRSSGSWGNRHIDHDNFGQHSGQTRDYNNRRNRYFQDRR